jgi:hypothetical protein
MRLYPLFITSIFTLFIHQSYSEAAPKTAGQVRKYVRAQAKTGRLIAKLPLTSKAVNTRKKAGAEILETSGTPPKLVDIPNSTIKNLFWGDGIIDSFNSGIMPENGCFDFLGSPNDGQSAGISACYLAQNVGYSFQTALQSAASFCYMQKMSTAPAGVAVSGAASVNSAMAPNSGTEDKIVKALITGFPEEGGPTDQTIFFVIPGKGANIANGNLYAHTLYFCNGGTAVGKETATIKNNLEYSISAINQHGAEGTFSSTVTSKITLDDNNRIIFNPATDKQVNIASSGGSCSYMKAEMTLSNGKIRQKSMDDCGGPEARKAYSAMRYTGTSIQTLRFKEGGSKDNYSSIITEFRDSKYVSAPNNTEFNADLSEVDINTDTYYDGAPTLDTNDLTSFNCNRTDNVATITMDFSNPTLQAYTANCNDRSLDNMDFCRSDPEVNNAENYAFEHCFG